MNDVIGTRDRLGGPEIGAAVRTVSAHFAESPRSAQITDLPATATLESGLRCRVSGPDDWQLTTDMHPTLGGTGSAPYPSWVLRAAVASCVATTIAMRAAAQELTLWRLEVRVDSDTDLRGLLGVGDPAGSAPSMVRVDVTIDADAPAAALHELVRWAVQASPVGAAVAEPVQVSVTSPEQQLRAAGDADERDVADLKRDGDSPQPPGPPRSRAPGPGRGAPDEARWLGPLSPPAINRRR